ncbi:DUF3024 domain-containing protein [Dictyobacter arantiisoli]|uniref:Uncharacterized protein n=1 Tax=Dictyobacter arantiisoli TaxID=2014874 RepID=A0A5A5TKC3_9CHLR|nr:hypothetical protein [Dictyobacter arantiisoli]GCF11887.1 hypothetical protein KDI_54510 [Dictyobacter arantiisoli]
MTRESKHGISGTPRSKLTRIEVPEVVKTEVTTKANELIEKVLKPQHIQPPPDNPQFNYIIDIYGKWYQRYFYLCATYRVPYPNATVPSFEAKMARMEYAGENHFHLSFMRHTGQWVELYTDVSLDEGLASIRDEPFFFP